MALAIGAVLVDSVANPCCCTPGDCCLYPWPQLTGIGGTTVYPATDTPDTLNVTTPDGSATFTKVPDPDYADFRWEGTIDGQGWVLYANPDGYYDLTDNGAQSFRSDCLIEDYDGGIFGTSTVADFFPDTLFVTNIPPADPVQGEPVSVTRISHCIWQGEDGNGNPLYVAYLVDIQTIGPYTTFGEGNYRFAVLLTDGVGEFTQEMARDTSNPAGNYYNYLSGPGGADVVNVA